MENYENNNDCPDLGQQLHDGENRQPENEEPVGQAQPHVDPADDPEIRKLIEEAENRGYLRGRNENIENFIAKNFENEPFEPDDSFSEPCPAFLSHIRHGFWDD